MREVMAFHGVHPGRILKEELEASHPLVKMLDTKLSEKRKEKVERREKKRVSWELR